MNEQELT